MFLIVENVSLQAQCHASDELEHTKKDPAGPYFFCVAYCSSYILVPVCEENAQCVVALVRKYKVSCVTFGHGALEKGSANSFSAHGSTGNQPASQQVVSEHCPHCLPSSTVP